MTSFRPRALPEPFRNLPRRVASALLPPCILLAFNLITIPATAQFVPFVPVDTNFVAATHTIPASPVKSTILLRSQVSVSTNYNGQTATVKDNLDFIGYVPIQGRSDSGYVIVNTETENTSNVHGDGGGMVVFTAQFKNDTWSVAPHPGGNYRTVDFRNVGGTWVNCAGSLTPWGTVLTGEESNDNTMNNTLLYNGGARFRDTTDWPVTQFNGDPVNRSIKRHQNMNWVVEVDPATARAVKKHYNMGRASHELGYAMPDGRTTYMTDDDTPAAFYKFVSDSAGNYTRGQLYFYRQSVDAQSGSWIPMPMNLDTMINTTSVAMRRGATMFTRHEWVLDIGDKVYITETGNDNSGTLHRDALRIGRAQGGRLAKHLESRVQSDSSLIDYYGRILRLDTATGKMDVFLEGGAGSGGLHFSNPDCITKVTLGDKTYMVICEDINGTSQGRVSAAANTAGRTVNELYWLDMSIPNPTRNDLKRMLVGAAGAEITGARFTPDGKTIFVNVQHPTSSNAAPYNTSYTVAMWGYQTATGLVFDPPTFGKSDRLQVEVNAASRMAYFDRETDVSLHDATGKRLERHRKTRTLDLRDLSAGTYYLRFGGGEAHKIVVQ